MISVDIDQALFCIKDRQFRSASQLVQTQTIFTHVGSFEWQQILHQSILFSLITKEYFFKFSMIIPHILAERSSEKSHMTEKS